MDAKRLEVGSVGSQHSSQAGRTKPTSAASDSLHNGKGASEAKEKTLHHMI